MIIITPISQELSSVSATELSLWLEYFIALYPALGGSIY